MLRSGHELVTRQIVKGHPQPMSGRRVPRHVASGLRLLKSPGALPPPIEIGVHGPKVCKLHGIHYAVGFVIR